MARIELRDCTVYIKDGLGRTPTSILARRLPTRRLARRIRRWSLATPPARCPARASPRPLLGRRRRFPSARFTIAGETAATVHVVTARTQDTTNVDVTTDIVFSPALGAGTYAIDAAITFSSQQLEVKIGEGNITYTEKSDYAYLLDRDNLDTVKEGKDVPLDVKWDSVYEFITTGTSEEITPMDALKGINGASEWITYSKDPCEPYAVAIEVDQVPPCSTAESESTLFPDFRSEQREVNFKDATISITGKCNVTQPIVTRIGS